MTQEYNRARHLFTSQRTATRAWEARNPKRSRFQETFSGSPLNFLRAYTREYAIISWQQSERHFCAAYYFSRAEKIVLTIFSQTHLPHAKFSLAMQIPFIPFAIHVYIHIPSTYTPIRSRRFAVAFRRLNRENVNRLDGGNGGGLQRLDNRAIKPTRRRNNSR